MRGSSCMYPPDFAAPVALPVLPSCPGLPARLAAAPGSAGLHLPVTALALRRQMHICEVAPEEGRNTYLDTAFVPGNLTDRADMDRAWMQSRAQRALANVLREITSGRRRLRLEMPTSLTCRAGWGQGRLHGVLSSI